MRRRLCISVVLAVTVFLAVAEQPASGARKALFVGVEEYSTPEHNLKGVREDVRLLKESLVQKGVFSGGEMKTLLDREATRANILKTFKEWLIDGTAPGDTAFFYFSGHGIQIWDESGDEIQDGMDEAIMPWDAKAVKNRERRTFRGRVGFAFPLNGTQNFILDDELGDLLKQLKGRRVVFISDSCHSGSVHKRVNPFFVQYKTIGDPVSYKSVFEPRFGQGDVRAVGRNKPNILSNLEVPDAQLVVLTASEDSQPAEIVPFEKEPKGIHSVFTWYLLNGLEGKADLDKDGSITFEELARYLKEEVARDGYAQIPQHEFRPENTSKEVFVVQAAHPRGPLERPSTMGCYLKTDPSISPTQRADMLSQLKKVSPELSWTDDPARSQCMIEVQKSGTTYGARLSDSTGTYWEGHSGSVLNEALGAVMKNFRACFVQTSVAALRNFDSRIAVDLEYSVKGPAARRPGEVVKGDVLVFKAKAARGGYLYLFSVDCLGVIHPLYPGPTGPQRRLNAGESTVIGEDGSITIQPPFGKDVIFAFVSSVPLEALKGFWAKDDVGDPKSARLSEQKQFLDALWNGLTKSGHPKGEWASQSWSLKSFESLK